MRPFPFQDPPPGVSRPRAGLRTAARAPLSSPATRGVRLEASFAATPPVPMLTFVDINATNPPVALPPPSIAAASRKIRSSDRTRRMSRALSQLSSSQVQFVATKQRLRRYRDTGDRPPRQRPGTRFPPWLVCPGYPPGLFFCPGHTIESAQTRRYVSATCDNVVTRVVRRQARTTGLTGRSGTTDGRFRGESGR